MERFLLQNLKTWLVSSSRKPLILRGARQVGKTWLIKHLGEVCKKNIIELNFEKDPSLFSLFASNDVKQILINLNATQNYQIDLENSLLFLDEIQAVPQLFAKLRWFAEDLPTLPVIATGSLLEFVLTNHSFSMPVGRISYMHLEPLSFEEFLLANDKHNLFDYLKAYNFSIKIPTTIHEQFISLFKEYLLVGGLPAAVVNWCEEHSLSSMNQVQYNLLATYRDDFSKFNGRIAIERLEEVMMAIPKMLGQKFIFSRVNSAIQSSTLKNVIEILAKARICHRVSGCSANGVPLAAEIKEKYFKEIFLDVGLCSTALGLNLNNIRAANEIIHINNGAIAEQVVGQLLRTVFPPYIEPALYCWFREEKGSSAEIDYVIAHGNKVIPIEVKAGSTGGLKSLHLFMGAKDFSFAVRINSDLPNITAVDIRDSLRKKITYTLMSIPFYLMGQLSRLLDENHV